MGESVEINRVQKNIRLLTQLLRGQVAERYKRLAKESKLSKFTHRSVDPVLLVDVNLQVEREAIQLTEISLFELVTAVRLESELRRSALGVQRSFQLVYGEEELPGLDSESLLRARMRCLQSRVHFYNSFLAVSEDCESPVGLARAAFVEARRFEKKLEPVLEADRIYCDELVRSVPEIHRFLFRKQADHELEKQILLWREFQSEVFRKPQALP